MYPKLIDDPRLTPDLQRTRSGSRQEFRAKDKRSFEADFYIDPPERHIFAELIDGQWFWVNGCDVCNNKKEMFGAYKRCLNHDVCCDCETPRHTIKTSVWGHQDGFQCKPCHQTEHDTNKAEALAKMGEYNELDFSYNDKVTCPYCNQEFDQDECEFYDSEETECDRCGNKFLVTTNHEVTFTTKRI